MRRLSLLLAFPFLLHPAPSSGGEDVPEWLRSAAAARCPEYDSHVTAVVLLADQAVRVERDGRAAFLTRYAVRVLRREGAVHAVARIPYRTDGGRVRDLRGWVVPPRGEAQECRDRDIADVAALNGDMYNELRVRVLDASGEVVEGAVFGYEAEYEDRGIDTQYQWDFQGELPTLRSRFALTAPPDWPVEGVLINHEPLEPRLAGSTREWELQDLPPIPNEPYRPPTTALVPRLAVSVFAPPGDRGKEVIAFRSWTEASAWLSKMADPRAETAGAVAAKARELAARGGTERERIEAVGRFVQGITYASIQLGTTRGGGYIPRPAGEVLARGYGDCKDKANLMKALLRALDIPAYLVPIYIGDRDYVRETWPSLQQFNHCIVAVRVREPFDGPVYRHPVLGQLVLFDPTDPDVPFGSLPDEEQASLALLVAGGDGVLIRVPETSEAGVSDLRRVDARLGADGALTARISERSTGRYAEAERRGFRERKSSDYREMLERWLSREAAGTEIARFDARDQDSGRAFALDVEFRAARYARPLGGRMLAVPPIVIDRGGQAVFPDSNRTLPVILRFAALEETTRTQLPQGFAVEELPRPVLLRSPFGQYGLNCRAQRDTLVVTRSYRVRSARVEPREYASLREFFSAIRAAEQQLIVLSHN